MRNFLKLKLLSVLLLLSVVATAQEQKTFKTNFFNEVEFPKTVTVTEKSLQCNGYGALSQNLSKIFSCALYVAHPSDDAINLIYSDDLKVIELVMTSNNLQSEATIKRMRKAYAVDLKVGADASESDKKFVAALRKQEQINPSQVITVEKLFGEAFKNSNAGNTETINSEIVDYIASFSDLIVKGDHFRIISQNNLVTLYKNGNELFQTNNKAFKKALMNIYLGNTPIDTSLRDDLLSL
ncbi:chalcone isomerase family protein [Flammeovirga kamogawensis]|uniref:Chalcone isomerase family protein n=1 Tax=Flammeovirga kamogawensis TaxID=373891 RepID=A0ABX8H1P0_9BACT|nr:chalcone isomerase family protein [Flammeovirga kamogawensis]MBB6462384.1 hypothetical protein [Flammeovirga kamogawensis]QWG09497.1 chalcone isomerase family protein [Flammeovirga kamogawensis]TRX65013.1 hypothetical protein EO216_21000 [Flammeovirga kamogawensis]